MRIIHWSVALAALIDSFLDGEALLHHWLGYAAAGLVALRMVWGVVGPRPARFSSFPPSLSAARAHLAELAAGTRRVHLSHDPLGALMVCNLWATLAALAATGYMMGMMTFFGVEWVEELHEAAWSWLMISVALHVGGVMFETRRTGVPLVRAMIDGRKRIPEGFEAE
ncbi:cytochrome b/b6 domain-containing protein [Oceanicella actignis]|uniref:cytochrome b/b6 domain-containing protein n=1 Tax=Oceanicella actignis TaxID=1189325 RepID=UPI001254CA89|nr:cytochrome b/b6 domain-containing protein [Oceanicella actignis]TYO89091.1 cytochrome b [Oceanicella actignis]